MRSRFFPIVLSLVLATAAPLFSQHSPCSPDAYCVGVLRGPTAVAFAPLIEDASMGRPATLSDGRAVEIAAFPTPNELIGAYVAGRVDAATLPSNAAAILAGRGLPIEVSATFLWGVLYLVGPAGERLSEVAGEVETIGRGATPDFIFRYILREEGLSERVVPSYGFAQVELSQLLIAGRERYGVLPEPFVTQVLRQNPALGIVADLQQLFRRHAGVPLPQTVLVARPQPSVSEELVAILAGSVSEVLDSPVDAGATVETLGIGLDAATVVEALPRLNLRVESAADSEAALRRYFEILFSFAPEAVGGALPEDSFYGR